MGSFFKAATTVLFHTMKCFLGSYQIVHRMFSLRLCRMPSCASYVNSLIFDISIRLTIYIVPKLCERILGNYCQKSLTFDENDRFILDKKK